MVAHVMEDVVGSQGLAVESEFAASACDADNLEQQIGVALQNRIGTDRFDMWFDRKTRMTVGGNALIVEAANSFSANWIRGKFADDLRAAAQNVLRRNIEVCVRVGHNPAPIAPAHEGPHTTDRPA